MLVASVTVRRGAPTRRTWAWAGLAVFVGFVVVSVAFAVWAIFFWSGCSFPEDGSRACAGEAGFVSLDEVEVLDARKVSWLDTSISFQLRGTPDAIDHVLDSAGFTTPLSEDDLLVSSVRRDAEAADLGELSDVVYGSDTWTDPHGRPVYREVLRADLPGEGSGSVLFVFASR